MSLVITFFIFYFLLWLWVKLSDKFGDNTPIPTPEPQQESPKVVRYNDFKTVHISNDFHTPFYRRWKAAYLKSDLWHQKCVLVRARDNHQCQICGSRIKLNVHHMSGYDLIPNEPISCLITLCVACHKEQHDLYGYPQTKDEYLAFKTPTIKPTLFKRLGFMFK